MQPTSSETTSHALTWFAPLGTQPAAAPPRFDEAHAASERLFAEVVVSKVLLTAGLAVAASVVVLWLARVIG